MKKLEARKVYIFMEGALALLFSMIFTASSVYQVTVAELSALQLVLVGTTLEGVVFLFEIPTGIVADVYSRRLSIIIGLLLIGLGFVVEGSFPIFLMILLAQFLWGLGYTFTSGATQAWISDEIGEAAAGRIFLRGNQIGNFTALFGMGAGMALGNLRVSLPIQIGGYGLILLGILLALTMPETGFNPRPREERSTWASFSQTFFEGLRAVRKRPSLIRILGIGLIFGLYSEGFDRLWTKHILDNFTLPMADVFQPVVWFGALSAVSLVLSIGATEIVRRKVRTEESQAVARAIFLLTTLLVIGLFSFALSNALLLALAAYWLIDVARDVISPLYTAWVNQRLDSRVRATVLSMSGQVDAVGQIAGGPIVGVIGSLLSVRAALLTSSLILTPALALFTGAAQEDATIDPGVEDAS